MGRLIVLACFVVAGELVALQDVSTLENLETCHMKGKRVSIVSNYISRFPVQSLSGSYSICMYVCLSYVHR